MKKNKYKVLVLSNLKKSESSVLRSAISLAKMIHGNIQFFHVRKPSEIVEKDNQLSAMRVINSKYIETEKKIQNTIDPISKEFGTPISYSFAFGNIKDEILAYITKHKPDIIVLGKRKYKTLKVIGDNITELILKVHQGPILIAGNENILEPNKELSLGILNDLLEDFNIEFAENLMEHSQEPLKSFKIVKNSSELKESKDRFTDPKTIEYVFEQSDNDLNVLSKYLKKSNVNLLCLAREKKDTKKSSFVGSAINDVIDKLKVSILLTSTQRQIV